MAEILIKKNVNFKLSFYLVSVSNFRYYILIYEYHVIVMWGSKIWAHDLGPGTTFHQQHARGEEIIEDRCN